ncbi:MAG: shikimate kinase [Arcobacteraceae bacterium]
MKNIIITGFMATGKSVVAKRLAKKIGMNYIDMDKVIEERHQMSITDIFARYGETYFREQENRLAKELSLKENKVIATGGGTMVYLENIKYFTINGLIICLWCKPEIIKERVMREKDQRPLIKDNLTLNNINALLNKRRRVYEDYILKVDTTNLTIDDVVYRIINLILNHKYN